MTKTPRAYIDFESASTADLRKTGTHVYAPDPDTRILCMAYAIGDGPVRAWRPGDPTPQDLLDHIRAGHDVSGWNTGGFEQIMWATFMPPHWLPIPRSQWLCSMIKAAYWGLPMKLRDAALALHLSHTKDDAGHRLMMQMSKPRKDGSWWHDTDKDKYDRLVAYCMQDVEVERAIDKAVPDLPDEIYHEWVLELDMNERGVAVDVSYLDGLERAASAEIERIKEECRTKYGITPAQTSELLLYINHQTTVFGVTLSDVRAGTVAEAIKQLEDLSGQGFHVGSALDMLRLRQNYAKTSVKKFAAIKKCLGLDGRIRGMFQFYGASRTGREAGRLVQLQNLPRPDRELDLKGALHDLMEADTPIVKHVKSIVGVRDAIDTINDYMRDFYGNPLDVYAGLIRGVFIPGRGCVFVVGDLAQIEARVLAWLAGHREKLDVFARGEDLYVYAAAKVGSTDRQYGKVQELALGYGMGAGRFQETAATYGVILDALQSEAAVNAWRMVNKPIVDLWWACDRAARAVLDDHRQVVTIRGGKLHFAMGKGRLAGCLLVKLPSGRLLVYRNARVRYEDATDTKGSIVYDGVDQKTRLWGLVRTYGAKLVENIVQAIARDVMFLAMVRIDNATNNRLRPVMTVHDELVCEVPDTHTGWGVDKLQGWMTAPPTWGPDLPLAADVKIMQRYGK